MAKTTAEKLGVKEGATLLVLETPAGWSPGPLPAAATVTPVSGSADLVLLFAPDAAALDATIGKALDAVPFDGLVWVAYRKGGAKAGTDLNRDILQERLSAHGLVGVTLIALDSTWSAMRVRPLDRPGQKPR
ncbi:hypothetical protein ACIA6C_18265 [Streptomyces sp. NPDC051578]|uniref:hypothetical protein n=1 Tax=Streptomyces sp. NPDC051578 TaxID=3365662 RepID=UPI0037878BB7